MSGRRSQARFIVASQESVLRAALDVVLVSVGHEFVAISQEPSTVGDALTIEIVAGNDISRIAVRVEDSRPIVAAGGIRHRIRLSRVNPTGQAI